MLNKLINFSVNNRFIIFILTASLIALGLYSSRHLNVGAVPDVTNNQVQVLTTSRNLSTLDVEQFITYPIELEMANLQGVKEIRSVSKFGLSVVTIVFEEKLGTFLPRQLISEKLKSATDQIPEEYGSPEMGPISTGLGEIYQYLLDVKPGYEDKYSPMQLRTIQDWIVKRQLSGIPGVVEVNTWGGYLKQYEVAIQMDQLNALGIALEELLNALESNNSVSGGGYITKANQSYFIRGEGLIEHLDDIGNIFIKYNGSTPIYVKDVANVQFGHAPRFGAITANGKGESVLGQVMMLKGASSKDVVDRVKQRVETINKNLPEGVYINDFLDRSQLIDRTTNTIEENLVFGFLIVSLVVIFLLGNLRSALVISSVIPLALLFALTLMRLFHVDANLMSLGAIDFGIIIDGVVIIVEYIVFQMTRHRQDYFQLSSRAEQQQLKNEITKQAASKMMHSAIFGQLIILIVFIPILSLSGVEGKMFKPMALVFCFSLIGAMLLCLTYVPALSSWLLQPKKEDKKNFSDRLINGLQNVYERTLKAALNHAALVLIFALVLLIIGSGLYQRMGAEFVPTLEEGDMVIQPVLKSGTSLDQTIALTTKIEELLLDNYPEVMQIASRIGAAEVPTDPMSMEEADVIIRLKPKKEWTSARDTEDLANQFKKTLSVIPGMEVEFTQPIEMRFNELITGVRSDIAIKIMGQDLDTLYQKAIEIQKKVEDIPGAADVVVDKTVGLPQMTVRFDRQKIGRYGLNIKQVSEAISMAFAGQSTGVVFEGERRFDLVVRLAKNERRDIEHLKKLTIDSPHGKKIPLVELADIQYTKGPALISRDNTQRRIVVGINVRNRDLQSVVDDIKNIVSIEVRLPPGYSITYGGQFQNLQSARQRLAFAVPIALILIFILLYLAFQSLKEALLIFSAIPLAVVGGIVALYLRHMPFSISAGVGFIALFGIAVLNGIVLIEHFKELKASGMQLKQRIITGAGERLRPVLLTAMAAAFGFLPMAISTNSGAEVQRPLATVVIGGLITATLLTLIVLPVLYYLMERKVRSPQPLILLLLLLLPRLGEAQGYDQESLISLAKQNNLSIKEVAIQMEQFTIQGQRPIDLDNSSLYYSYDQNNLTVDNQVAHVIGLSQSLPFPGKKKAKQNYFNEQAELINTSLESVTFQLEYKIREAYNRYQIIQAKQDLYLALDSLYKDYERKAERKLELGSSNQLEVINARAKALDIELKLKQLQKQSKMTSLEIQQLVQSPEELNIMTEQPNPVELSRREHPQLKYIAQLKEVNRAEYNLEKATLRPELDVGYELSLADSPYSPLNGFSIGFGLPIFKAATKARLKAIEKNDALFDLQAKQHQIQQNTYEQRQMHAIQQSELAIAYYQKEGQQLAEEWRKVAKRSFQEGEIDYFSYIQSLERATAIEINYLNELENYNHDVLSSYFFIQN